MPLSLVLFSHNSRVHDVQAAKALMLRRFCLERLVFFIKKLSFTGQCDTELLSLNWRMKKRSFQVQVIRYLLSLHNSLSSDAYQFTSVTIDL